MEKANAEATKLRNEQNANFVKIDTDFTAAAEAVDDAISSELVAMSSSCSCFVAEAFSMRVSSFSISMFFLSIAALVFFFSSWQKAWRSAASLASFSNFAISSVSRFFTFAMGSCAETDTKLSIAKLWSLLPKPLKWLINALRTLDVLGDDGPLEEDLT